MDGGHVGTAGGTARDGHRCDSAPVWSVSSLASQAGTLSELSGGRFILGLGTGGSYSADFRAMYGLRDVPAVAMMRDYLVTLRGLLDGKVVTHEGKAITLRNMQASAKPLAVPLYIASLGRRCCGWRAKRRTE